MDFPSWHIVEEDWLYVGYLYLDEYSYRRDESSDRVSDAVDIDSAVEKALDKMDCVVYEVDPFDFGIMDILYDPMN